MLLTLLISLEVLLVNLTITYFCTKHKYSLQLNVIVLFFTTVLLYLFSYFVLQQRDGPSIWGIILGITYIVPLYFLLNVKMHQLLYIMTFSWVYTLIVSGISQIIAEGLFGNADVLSALIIQTVLFLATLMYVINFAKSRILFILLTVDRNWRTLILFSTAMFLITIIVRHALNFTNNLIQIVLLLLLLIVYYVFHHIFYLLFKNKSFLSTANQLAHTDMLTNTPNRYALFERLETLIKNNTHFMLIFSDLDNFKVVNDKFSHSTGDQYLQSFSSICKMYISNYGTFYRFAGDEFVCVITSNIEAFDLEIFYEHVTREMNKKCDFFGFSFGVSRFPEDGDTPDALIDQADKLMYDSKGYRSQENRIPKTRSN